MSRSYNFEVEVTGINEEQQSLVEGIIDGEMCCWVIDGFEVNGGYAFHGSLSLGGGMDEQEAHSILVDAIREELPNAKDITTKWLCTEYQHWDEVFHDCLDEEEE
ncbi:MAG: hypothetical protein ACWGQW_20950 [bacterium]